MAKEHSERLDDHSFDEDQELLKENSDWNGLGTPSSIANQVPSFINNMLTPISACLSLFAQRRMLKIFGLGVVLWVLATAFHFSGSSLNIIPRPGSRGRTKNSPFTGAFARFPRISDLSPNQKRLSLIAVWNDDNFAPYLRHFYYTIQKNADSIDLLLINRIKTPGASCLDFEKANVDITWGGNVRVHCLQDEEYHKYLVDFMCSAEHGWNCDAAQYMKVTEEFAKREDPRNYDWRPFLGFAFRSLFANPQNPHWAWVDQDCLLGNFQRYPFNLLSEVSLVTGREQMPSALFMAGQLTGFNFEDPELGRAWTKFKGLRSVTEFVEHTEGQFPNSAEERLWSEGYMRSLPNYPGANLSYVIYPDLHGDDYFDGRFGQLNATQAHVISGRELLLISTSFTREQIENVILLERKTPADDLGSVGWTGGEDGSGYLLEQPNLTSEEARKAVVQGQRDKSGNLPTMHQGIVEDFVMNTTCYGRPKFVQQCVPLHPLTYSKPAVYRQSVVRFKEQQPMHVFRRLERDDRPRGYERKIIRHHLYTLSRGNPWFELPPFDITDDMVLMSNADFVQVWKMGPARAQTIFYRASGQKSIG